MAARARRKNRLQYCIGFGILQPVVKRNWFGEPARAGTAE